MYVQKFNIMDQITGQTRLINSKSQFGNINIPVDTLRCWKHKANDRSLSQEWLIKKI